MEPHLRAAVMVGGVAVPGEFVSICMACAYPDHQDREPDASVIPVAPVQESFLAEGVG